MSSRRARSRHSAPSSDERINELLSKLQILLYETPRARNNDPDSSAMLLQDTCNCIRSLRREVDGLSERLSELLNSTEHGSAQAAVIRSLLM